MRSTCCSTPMTQAPEAIVDGAALTALRTAAVSGLATRHLADPDARRLVLFGAGVQARLAPGRDARGPPDRGRSPSSSRTPGARRGARGYRTCPRAAASAAVPGEPDVARRRPRLHVHDERRAVVRRTIRSPPGAHVNAVGSYQPTSRELDTVDARCGLGWSSRREMRRSPRPGSCASRSPRARSDATTSSPISPRSRTARRSRTSPDDITRLQVRRAGVRGSDRGTRGGGRRG